MGGIYATYKDKAGAAHLDSWASRSACKGQADVLEDPKRVVDARKMCAHCPVIQKCALWLVAELNDRDDPGGYRAGMTERERQDARCEFKRALKRKRAAKTAPEPTHDDADAPRKICGKCRKPKPVTEFFRNKATKDGLTGSCKSCDIAARTRRKREQRRRERLAAARQEVAA